MDTKVRFANSMLSLASFTGFAVIGELDAKAVARLSESRSSKMSTPESIIQDNTSSIANTRRTMASCDYLKSCSRSRWNKTLVIFRAGQRRQEKKLQQINT
jgi:hypothetical protein